MREVSIISILFVVAFPLKIIKVCIEFCNDSFFIVNGFLRQLEREPYGWAWGIGATAKNAPESLRS